MAYRKILKILNCMVVGLMCAGGAMAADTVKIAFIDPLSGAFASVGDSGAKHFLYMADKINAAGGVAGGKKLEIVLYDNKISPKDSLDALKNAIDQGIHYVVQGNGSSVAGALIDAINKNNEREPEKKVLFLNYAALDPSFTGDKCSFWHFRFDAHVDMKMAAVSDAIAKNKNIKKVFLINQDYVFGQGVSAAAKKMLAEKRPDIKIVGETFHPIGKVKDFAPYVAEIQASGAEVVVTANWGNDLSLLIKAAGDAGLKADFYTYYGGGFGTPIAAGAAGEGHLKQVTEWHNNLPVEDKKADMEKFYNDFMSVNPKTEFYYFRVKTLMEMLAKAMNKSNSVDPALVAAALEGMEHETSTGKVTMRAVDHQLIQPLYLSTFTRKGAEGVKYDVDGSGFGWKTDTRIEADKTAMPTTCNMVRPK